MIIDVGKKTLIVIIISAVVVLGVSIYFAFIRPKPPIIPESQVTDIIAQNMIIQMEQYTQQMEALKNSVQREVNKIHATVKQEVTVMRPDDIAIGLNDELSRFRELSIRSGGMDNSGSRILD